MLLQPAEAARNRAVPSAGHNPFTHKWDVSALLQGRAMQAPRGATPENTSNARSVQSISRTMRNLVPLDITFRALYAHTLQRKVKKSQYDGAGPLRVALWVIAARPSPLTRLWACDAPGPMELSCARDSRSSACSCSCTARYIRDGPHEGGDRLCGEGTARRDARRHRGDPPAMHGGAPDLAIEPAPGRYRNATSGLGADPGRSQCSSAGMSAARSRRVPFTAARLRRKRPDHRPYSGWDAIEAPQP